jgi:hypothetical protein
VSSCVQASLIVIVASLGVYIIKPSNELHVEVPPTPTANKLKFGKQRAPLSTPRRAPAKHSTKSKQLLTRLLETGQVESTPSAPLCHSDSTGRGTKRVLGQVIVRCGGGWMDLEDYLKQYYSDLMKTAGR